MPIVTEDFWKGALEPYAEHPASALILAQTLHVLKQMLESGPDGKLTVTRACDIGIRHLFQYTTAYDASYKLFLRAVAGTLLPKHDPEQIIKAVAD